MASYTDEHLLKDLTEHIIPYADSLGMNEQELPNVFAILSQDSISIVSDAYPRVATTLDTMRKVFKWVVSSSTTLSLALFSAVQITFWAEFKA